MVDIEEILKKYKWAIPLIGGVLLIIAFVTPAIYVNEYYRWLWGVKVNFGEWRFEVDLMKLLISLIFSILILFKIVKVVRISNKVRIEDINIEEAKTKLIKKSIWIIIFTIVWMVLMDVTCNIGYRINLEELMQGEFPVHEMSCFDYWSVYRPGFGIIGMFLGAGVTIMGAVLLKADLSKLGKIGEKITEKRGPAPYKEQEVLKSYRIVDGKKVEE